MLKMAATNVLVILSVLTGLTLHSCLVVGKRADESAEKSHYERKAGM